MIVIQSAKKKPPFFVQSIMKKLLKKLKTSKIKKKFSFGIVKLTLRVSKIFIVSSVWNDNGAKITIDPLRKKNKTP